MTRPYHVGTCEKMTYSEMRIPDLWYQVPFIRAIHILKYGTSEQGTPWACYKDILMSQVLSSYKKKKSISWRKNSPWIKNTSEIGTPWPCWKKKKILGENFILDKAPFCSRDTSCTPLLEGHLWACSEGVLISQVPLSYRFFLAVWLSRNRPGHAGQHGLSHLGHARNEFGLVWLGRLQHIMWREVMTV
jgi:hypothetical protein